MIENATVCWTEVEQATLDALPKLDAFQELMGKYNTEEAGAHVFMDELKHPHNGENFTPDELQHLGGWALVYSAHDQPYRLRRVVGVQEVLAASGELQLLFNSLIVDLHAHTEPDAESAKRASDRWLKNRVGEIIEELIAYWDKKGGPYIREAEVLSGPFHNSLEARETAGHWHGAEVSLLWGRND